MPRFYFLNGETGMRYPITLGLGTFGVDSPIDVSRSGGGFAMSVYFNIVQMLRTLDFNLSYGANAGFDVSPFFPVGHKPRLLFNARLVISTEALSINTRGICQKVFDSGADMFYDCCAQEIADLGRAYLLARRTKANPTIPAFART